MNDQLTPSRSWRGRVRRVGAAAAVAVALTAGSIIATPSAANANGFNGVEAVFVANDGHLRNIDPNGNIENHGPSIAVGAATGGVAITSLANGGFIELFRGSNGLLWQGNNNGYHQFTSRRSKTEAADSNTTPGLALNAAGNIGTVFVQNGRVVFLPPTGAVLAVDEGAIAPNTSPAIAALSSSPSGFIITWVDPNGHLNWNTGSGSVHVATNFTAWPNLSPTVAGAGLHFQIEVRSSTTQIWQVNDNSAGVAFATVAFSNSAPSNTELSNGSFGSTFTDTSGNLWVNGQNIGVKVEQGNFPAISANGTNGGWKVIFMGQNLDPMILDNTGQLRDFAFPLGMAPNISPHIAAGVI